MKKQGSEVPFPGVHNSQGRGPLTIKHTKYYQWVAFTLFFQVSTESFLLFLSPLLTAEAGSFLPGRWNCLKAIGSFASAGNCLLIHGEHVHQPKLFRG